MSKRTIEFEYIYWSVEEGIIERDTHKKELTLRVGDYIKINGRLIERYNKIIDIRKVYNFDREIMHVILTLEKYEEDDLELIL